MPQETQVVIIKKYANRRLYDTSISQYITLENLYDMVQRGEEFEVLDAKTDENLTQSILTQIILDQDTKGHNLLPTSFLRQLIRMYDKDLSKVLPPYLESSMNMFLENQTKFQQMGNQQSWSEFNPMQMFEDVTKQNFELMEKSFSLFGFDTKNEK